MFQLRQSRPLKGVLLDRCLWSSVTRIGGAGMPFCAVLNLCNKHDLSTSASSDSTVGDIQERDV